MTTRRARVPRRSLQMGRALPFLVLVALLLPGAGRGDIGIVKLAPTTARPGDAVSVVAVGYLGRKPWRPTPVVMIPARLAPRCCASPRARLSDLRPPRYRIVGSVRRWRPLDNTGVNGRGRRRFRLSNVAPGRYIFGLFCGRCARGERGSVIIDWSLVLRVQR